MLGVNCQPQHQDHYLLPEAPPGFALADIFPGQLGVATPTLYGPYGQTPSTLRRLLSRWRPMAVLDPLPLDHLFPARGSFLMRLSLLSLLKTSLPLLEGAGSLLGHRCCGTYTTDHPSGLFCPSASFLATSPDQTLSRTPRDTGLSVLGTQTPAP